MNIEFIEALEEMAKEKGIPREDLYEAIRKGLAAAYQEEYHTELPVEVQIDSRSGDISINNKRIDLAKFGRIATKKAEETIRQEITEKRRKIVYELYIHRVGEIITGAIHRFEGKSVWINLGDAEALLLDAERIPGERYHAGERLRAYLMRLRTPRETPASSCRGLTRSSSISFSASRSPRSKKGSWLSAGSRGRRADAARSPWSRLTPTSIQ